MELGILKTVTPRQKWNNEARDFTPWLANNISELNKALGLELEVENTEVSVGPYSADILAKDTGTDNYVVIENQLEKTNHDHLGKAITYASVLDASMIIWIATEFTEEHKKSLDWLNDHTNDEISFYGVQLELWQIDESKAALRFNVISKPNQAVRQAARSKANEDLSDKRKFQFDFWSKFKEKLAKTKKIPSLQTPRPQYWFDVTLGKSYIHISNTCNTDDNTVGVRIYIGNKIADTMLPFLESKKDEIESSIGQKLIWNPNPDNRDKVIILQHTTDFEDERKLDESLNWLVDYTIKFRETFSKIIKQAP
ncbi:DUF4268 domain-containing protein [Oceanihabitans sp. IOP_32]|uniref:DUF4268 domain-containing protein n=1 Tax=Oceanihabitans sp. IOP_32 TaxID=2529032 RepID=UPI001292EA2A|nr:DUF4268 domain-containing protein [Oceanihabitans sp. IOP_32]QFZ55367.1 DUF4268 domain-containing protein [Oceanihabitans sp. IOP_32]